MELTTAQAAEVKKEVKSVVLATTIILPILVKDTSMSTEQKADRVLELAGSFADTVVERLQRL